MMATQAPWQTVTRRNRDVQRAVEAGIATALAGLDHRTPPAAQSRFQPAVKEPYWACGCGAKQCWASRISCFRCGAKKGSRAEPHVVAVKATKGNGAAWAAPFPPSPSTQSTQSSQDVAMSTQEQGVKEELSLHMNQLSYLKGQEQTPTVVVWLRNCEAKVEDLKSSLRGLKPAAARLQTALSERQKHVRIATAAQKQLVQAKKEVQMLEDELAIKNANTQRAEVEFQEAQAAAGFKETSDQVALTAVHRLQLVQDVLARGDVGLGLGDRKEVAMELSRILGALQQGAGGQAVRAEPSPREQIHDFLQEPVVEGKVCEAVPVAPKESQGISPTQLVAPQPGPTSGAVASMSDSRTPATALLEAAGQEQGVFAQDLNSVYSAARGGLRRQSVGGPYTDGQEMGTILCPISLEPQTPAGEEDMEVEVTGGSATPTN